MQWCPETIIRHESLLTSVSSYLSSVVGLFTNADGKTNADNVARWDGSAWQPLGSGLDGEVNAIAVSGAKVYVGGSRTHAGGSPDADYLAVWDGSAWGHLSTQLDANASEIVLDGSNLYIGGYFSDAGGDRDADRIAVGTVRPGTPSARASMTLSRPLRFWAPASVPMAVSRLPG